MSYDLCFWTQQPGSQKNAQEVYAALVDGRTVNGLVPFPVEAYLDAIKTNFPEAVREDGPSEQVTWRSDDERSMFEITWSPLHALVTLRRVDTEHANRLVEIAASFGAPLYDPQTGERFDSWTDG